MPYEIKLDQSPAGYVMEDATGEEGSTVRVVVREFTSSDDGELFSSRLEGLPSIILGKLPKRVDPGGVVSLLAVIRKDLTTTVYLNEVQFIVKIQGRRSATAGEPVFKDDIADIVELNFREIDVPHDSALAFLLSVGWRKLFFFDLVPLTSPEYVSRDYDLPKTLGGLYAYLSNSTIFRLTDDEWDILIRNGWFPFISLPGSLLNTLVGRARSSGVLDILTPKVAQSVHDRLPQMLERWRTSAEFEPHYALIDRAAERFLAADFVSTVSILFPRIEGLLRSSYGSLAIPEHPNAERLSEFLVKAGADSFHSYSWLLPHRFNQYLKECYFAGFEPGQPARLSRTSVSHGVADLADFDQKHASIGFLILDQIYYLMRRVAADRAKQSPPV